MSDDKITNALDNLDMENIEPKTAQEKAEGIAQAIDEASDIDQTDLLAHDVRTSPSEKMNMMFVANKKPGWKYRWIRKADELRRKAQGWITDSEATAMKQGGGKVNATHDMILMRIPLEKAKEISQYWENRSKKLVKSLSYEDKGQKELAAKYLKSKGVPARVIDSLL